MMDDFVVCCSWREWSCGRERNFREVQKGTRASFPKACPGESNSRMYSVTKEFPGQLSRKCYRSSVSISKSCSKETYLILFSNLFAKTNLFE